MMTSLEYKTTLTKVIKNGVTYFLEATVIEAEGSFSLTCRNCNVNRVSLCGIQQSSPEIRFRKGGRGELVGCEHRVQLWSTKEDRC